MLVSLPPLCESEKERQGTYMEYVYINGEYKARKDAVVSVEDRGLRFGDGAFETIYVRDGVPYLWEYHHRRLLEGLNACQIGFDNNNLREITRELISRNEMEEGILRISVTRGEGSRGYLPFPNIGGREPTIIIETTQYQPPGLEELDSLDITLGVSSYEKMSPKALPTQYKLMQGMNSILARIEAERKGHFDSLLLSREGVVSECSSSNIFWCIGKTLFTPSLESGCLAGVTRERIAEISEYRVRQDRFKLRHLLKANAVFICNSAFLVLPVNKLAGYTTDWSASKKLAKIYRMMLEKDIASQSED